MSQLINCDYKNMNWPKNELKLDANESKAELTSCAGETWGKAAAHLRVDGLELEHTLRASAGLRSRAFACLACERAHVLLLVFFGCFAAEVKCESCPPAVAPTGQEARTESSFWASSSRGEDAAGEYL